MEVRKLYVVTNYGSYIESCDGGQVKFADDLPNAKIFRSKNAAKRLVSKCLNSDVFAVVQTLPREEYKSYFWDALVGLSV